MIYCLQGLPATGDPNKVCSAPEIERQSIALANSASEKEVRWFSLDKRE